jgi:hypothetical protein
MIENWTTDIQKLRCPRCNGKTLQYLPGTFGNFLVCYLCSNIIDLRSENEKKKDEK